MQIIFRLPPYPLAILPAPIKCASETKKEKEYKSQIRICWKFTVIKVLPRFFQLTFSLLIEKHYWEVGEGGKSEREEKRRKEQFIKTAEGGERLLIVCTWSGALNLRYYGLLPSNKRPSRAIYVSPDLPMQSRFSSLSSFSFPLTPFFSTIFYFSRDFNARGSSVRARACNLIDEGTIFHKPLERRTRILRLNWYEKNPDYISKVNFIYT